MSFVGIVLALFNAQKKIKYQRCFANSMIFMRDEEARNKLFVFNSRKIVSGTLEIYKAAVDALLPTPLKAIVEMHQK